jgi:hypothetical protein
MILTINTIASVPFIEKIIIFPIEVAWCLFCKINRSYTYGFISGPVFSSVDLINWWTFGLFPLFVSYD